MATKYRLKLGDRDASVQVEEDAGGARLKMDGVWHEVSIEQIGGSAQYSLILDGKPFQLFAEPTPQGYHIVIGGRAYNIVANRAARPRRLAHGELPTIQMADGEWVLASPMAGVVQKVVVSPNDVIEEGDVLLIIEGMKMQNELRARHGGQVKAVYVSVGQQVEQGSPLLVFV
jgi:biotin carboxyl carrier protein